MNTRINNENSLPSTGHMLLNKKSTIGSLLPSSISQLYEPKKNTLPAKPIASRAPLQSRTVNHNTAENTTSIRRGTQTPTKSSAPSMVLATPVSSNSIYCPKRREIQMDSPGIDLLDKHDPQQASEFAKDIFLNAKKNELKYLPDPAYMEMNQPTLTVRMRAVLIDWLVDVHRTFKLKPETFFLTINIVDRFLGIREISKTKLQLVGVTALVIACKYEEIHFPDLGEFEKLCSYSFKRSDLLATERAILAALDFNVTVVTPHPFLLRYSKCGKINKDGQLTASYFAELAALEYPFLKFAPSVIACASLYLANLVQAKQDPWNIQLQYYSGYNTEDFLECAKMLLTVIKGQCSSQLHLMALRNKYLSPTRRSVARIALMACRSLEL